MNKNKQKALRLLKEAKKLLKEENDNYSLKELWEYWLDFINYEDLSSLKDLIKENNLEDSIEEFVELELGDNSVNYYNKNKNAFEKYLRLINRKIKDYNDSGRDTKENVRAEYSIECWLLNTSKQKAFRKF